jgi:type I restriction enzyme S subunit
MRQLTFDELTSKNECLEALPEIAKGWKWIRLGDKNIAEIIMGQSPPSSTYNQEGIGLPFYQGKADFGELYPSPRIWCNEPNKIAKSGDVLISVRAPVGPVNMCKEVSCIGRGLAAIRVKTNALNNLFLFYYLKSIEEDWVGKGSTFGAIKKRDLQDLQIPLPPLEVQKHIVTRIEEILSRVERAKKLREEALRDAEAIMQSALHEVFGKAEEKGWKWESLGAPETVKLIMGQSPPSSTYNENGVGLPFFQGKADFGLIYPTPRKWCNTPQKIALPNDVLISVRAPTGPVNICKEKCCIGRGLAAIRALEGLHYKFLFYFLRYLEPEMAGKGKGSTFGAITKKRLESLKIPLPPLEEQKSIVAYLDKLQEKVGALKKYQEETKGEIDFIDASVLDMAFRES